MTQKVFFLFFTLILTGTSAQNTSWNSTAVQPYLANHSYWQYKGNPVLLLGGSDNDNIFQMNHFTSHLDSLQDIRGNYIRCTMSDRDKGDLRAFLQNAGGRYDLSEWNPEYWVNFENLLRAAQERDIIVQIEVWDRFDHSREEWLSDPWNPGNNVNYSFEEGGLDSIYPNHPGVNEQPFFYTVPDLKNNETLLAYQKSFVDKLLSISLKYNNVLYCMDNETKGAPEWGRFWSVYLHEKAGSKQIYTTEMWDDWDVSAGRHKETIDHPEVYDFIDLSQNSQTTGHENWENPQKVFQYISTTLRPVNNIKIYGGPWNPAYVKQGKDADHAVQTFFKNIIGGFASSRFHRPPTGLGLSEISINAIKTIRAVESRIKFWNIAPRMDLLDDNETGEAYLAAYEGRAYVVYFPTQGDIQLNLKNVRQPLIGAWISTKNAAFEPEKMLPPGTALSLQTPDAGGWIFIAYTDK